MLKYAKIGLESCAMTEQVQSELQATEIRFLQIIKAVKRFDKVRNL